MACTPRSPSPRCTTASCPPAWPNSPTPTPQANSRQQPPPTAKPSIPSPSQHNSPHEQKTDSPDTNLTHNSGFADPSFATPPPGLRPAAVALTATQNSGLAFSSDRRAPDPSRQSADGYALWS